MQSKKNRVGVGRELGTKKKLGEAVTNGRLSICVREEENKRELLDAMVQPIPVENSWDSANGVLKIKG